MRQECLRVLELVGLKLPVELFRMLGRALGKNASLHVLCLNDTVRRGNSFLFQKDMHVNV